MSFEPDRGLSSQINSNLESDLVYPIWFFELDLDSGAIKLCSHSRDLDLGAKGTFKGTPNILNFSPSEETINIRSYPSSLTISGIPSDSVGLALEEDYQKRKFFSWVGLADSTSPSSPITTFFPVFHGQIDTMTIKRGPEESSIEIVCESNLLDLTNENRRRYTNGDQKTFKSSIDQGLSYLSSLQEKKILFGGREAFVSDETIIGGSSRITRQ